MAAPRPARLPGSDRSVLANDTLVGILVIVFVLLMPGMPGMTMLAGPDAPPGWSYNPSSFAQRAPIIALALVGFGVLVVPLGIANVSSSAAVGLWLMASPAVFATLGRAARSGGGHNPAPWQPTVPSPVRPVKVRSCPRQRSYPCRPPRRSPTA